MTKSGGDGQGVRRLRFGVMCRGYEFAAWEALCIRNLMEVEGVEPALLIIDDDPPQRPRGGHRLASLFDPTTLLWRIYQRAVLNRSSLSTRRADLSAELAQVPIMSCRALRSGKFVQRFAAEDVAEIRRHDLDFVMRFAFNILRGDILECARFGIWSFHHGDPEKYRGKPPGFWEIFNHDPITGAVLQRLTERLDSGVMLHSGYFRTDGVSYPRSRDELFFGAAEWPARVCKDIQNGNSSRLIGEPSSTVAPIYRAPNSLQMIRFCCIWLKAVLAKQVNSLFRFQQWSVGVIDMPVELVTGVAGRVSNPPVRSAHWIPEPHGRFLADPFAVECGGGLKILAEDYDWAAERGHIAEVERTADGDVTGPRPIIRLPFHLSYPSVLEVDGSVYCIPEMHEAGEVALYRADADLREWTRVATLLRGLPIIDPTVFRFAGTWWLFGTRQDHGANGKLFAWYATDLTGEWKAHGANPLKTDVRSSRPAGPVFSYNGDLFRPAQDCSTGYGAAVVVNRITCLTTDRFEEEVVSVIRPDPEGPYPTGLHTICGAGGKTVIDGSRWAFIPTAGAHALRRKFKRLLPERLRR